MWLYIFNFEHITLMDEDTCTNYYKRYIQRLSSSFEQTRHESC